MRGATSSYQPSSPVFQISTHTPHAGRNHLCRFMGFGPNRFQLTRPMRGATYVIPVISAVQIFQLTRPMRGATRRTQQFSYCGKKFQLTRPMRGATGPLESTDSFELDFNSHAPCGAQPREQSGGLFRPTIHFNSHAPCGAQRLIDEILIHIKYDFNSHAPCGAQQFKKYLIDKKFNNFNSHAPCGAQRSSNIFSYKDCKFQLTRPMRGATM